MRATLDIDDDIHTMAKEIASQRNQTMGRVLSDLVRQTLTANHIPIDKSRIRFIQRPPDAPITTREEVNRRRDEE
jgi:hypothetical protein